MLVLWLLSGYSSGWLEPRVPGVGNPFSQARMTVRVDSRPSAAGLERLEFQAVLPGLWFQEAVTGHGAGLKEGRGQGTPSDQIVGPR